jgi:hypothetical protein
VGVYDGELMDCSGLILVFSEVCPLRCAKGHSVESATHSTPWTNFRVSVPMDESGFEWRRHPSDVFKFKSARDGDHLVTPFQCHFCLFRLLTRRILDASNHQDEWLMCCLVRANIDAFWGREPATVTANQRNLHQLIKMWREVGLAPTSLLPPSARSLS